MLRDVAEADLLPYPEDDHWTEENKVQVGCGVPVGHAIGVVVKVGIDPIIGLHPVQSTRTVDSQGGVVIAGNRFV
jgi:hypothetical protein